MVPAPPVVDAQTSVDDAALLCRREGLGGTLVARRRHGSPARWRSPTSSARPRTASATRRSRP